MIKKLLMYSIVAFSFLLLLFSTIKGEIGNPSPKYISSDLKSAGKPFELSPERNRYAQLIAIVDHRSIFLPIDVAKIVVPDLGYSNGKFISIYPPGYSLILVPFYFVGSLINLSQLITFTVPSIFGIVSFIFLVLIGRGLKFSTFASILTGFLFLFATTVWPYTTTLYQHLPTSAFLLIIIWLSLKKNSFLSDSLIWLIAGFLIILDYPNAFFLAPLLLYSIFKNTQVFDKLKKIQFYFKYYLIISILFILPAVIVHEQYTMKVFNKPIAVTQQATDVRSFKGDKPVIKKENLEGRSAVKFFDISKFDRGFKVLTVSKDRGLLFYVPIIILAVFGIKPMLKKNKQIVYPIMSSVIATLILYSSFNDPWGGWAFGPRYLIPAFALSAVFLIAAIDKYIRNIFFLLLLIPLGIYSIVINGLGAVTSNQIPPLHEALGLDMKYNFLLNLEYLNKGISGSFFYNTFLRNQISLQVFYFSLISIVIFIFLILVLVTWMKGAKNHEL